MVSTKKFIETSEESISSYLREVRKIDLLTPEEEVELTKKVAEGDKRALDKLVNSNLRFVISVAKEYQGQGVPLVDLISEGNYGLIKAATKFDHTKGLDLYLTQFGGLNKLFYNLYLTTLGRLDYLLI